LDEATRARKEVDLDSDRRGAYDKREDLSDHSVKPSVFHLSPENSTISRKLADIPQIDERHKRQPFFLHIPLFSHRIQTYALQDEQYRPNRNGKQ
jgi:hypothetical protein